MGSRFRMVIAAGVLVAASVVGARPALADPTTDIRWSQPTAAATVSIGAASNRPGQTGWRAPTVTMYYFAFRTWCQLGPQGDCVPLVYVCDPGARDGSVWTFYPELHPPAVLPYTGTIILYDTAPIESKYSRFLWETRSVGVACVGESTGVRRPGVAPTAEEIWRQSSFAGEPPTVSIRPEGHGLTGLDTPLWMTSGNATANNTIDVTIRGWRVRADVFIRSVDWRVSDAATDSIVASDGAVAPNAASSEYGSQAAPLTTFRFRTKGMYRVSGTIVWGAVGTISNDFGFVRRIDFPDAGLSSSYDYPVDELVGVLNR